MNSTISIYHIINIFAIFAPLKDGLIMAKNAMGTKLSRKLEQKMAIMGDQIKLARLRRNLSIAQIAERATCSPLTINRIEKGSPTVSIGIYSRVQEPFKMVKNRDFAENQHNTF